MPQTSGSEKISIDGPVGRLEGLWLPAGATLMERAVVLCHPHPLHGGSMETKLVARTARRLSESGYQTLRFNFRGVGQSEGTWDDGNGERDDVVAALDYISDRLGSARLALFGFSFGAALGLDVGCRDERVEALIAVAPAVQRLPPEWTPADSKPILLVGASQDELVDPEDLREWVRARPDAVRLQMIEGADHLFTDKTDIVADAVVRFLESLH